MHCYCQRYTDDHSTVTHKGVLRVAAHLNQFKGSGDRRNQNLRLHMEANSFPVDNRPQKQSHNRLRLTHFPLFSLSSFVFFFFFYIQMMNAAPVCEVRIGRSKVPPRQAVIIWSNCLAMIYGGSLTIGSFLFFRSPFFFLLFFSFSCLSTKGKIG